MNRIDLKFKELRKKRQKAFIAFITAGDPDFKTTEDLVISFEGAGVDIVELGVPFSDPLADGPTIQAASQRALKKHVNIDGIFHAVERIRRRSQIPIALMTYYNPVFHYGEEKFLARAKNCGVDGILVPDLPPEEAGTLIRSAKALEMAAVFFLAPTTTNDRMRRIVKASTGFIYYVSLTGVTGARVFLSDTIRKHVHAARRLTGKPVCVGFGVSTAAQVKSIARMADGVIVGSAVINEIARNAGKKDLVQNVTRFIRNLTGNLD